MKIKIFSTKLQINSDKFKRNAIMYLEQLPQSLRRKEGKDSIMGISIRDMPIVTMACDLRIDSLKDDRVGIAEVVLKE